MGSAFPITFTRPQMGLVDQPEGGKPSVTQTGGTPSTQSSESAETSNDRPRASHPKPAPTTANRSQPTEPATSDVISTDGNGPETALPPSGRRARTRVIPADTDDDFAEFDL